MICRPRETSEVPDRRFRRSGVDRRRPRRARSRARARVARFAERAGYPLLADPLSGARHGPAAIAHYDLLLRDQAFTDARRARLDHPRRRPADVQAAARVARVARRRRADRARPGGRLAGSRAAVGARRSDPGRRSARGRPPGRDRTPTGSRPGARPTTPRPPPIATALGDELSEPLVAARLGDWLGPDSDAVRRLLDAGPRPRAVLGMAHELAPRVLSNRGANGIDGTVSSAFGAAAAPSEPVVLLIGDVALAHDIGGLLAARRLGPGADDRAAQQRRRRDLPLPPGRGRDRRIRGARRHAARPRFRARRGAVRVRDTSAPRRGASSHVVERSLHAVRRHVIEVRTDREQNLALHRRIAAAVSPRASAAAPRA